MGGWIVAVWLGGRTKGAGSFLLSEIHWLSHQEEENMKGQEAAFQTLQSEPEMTKRKKENETKTQEG